MRAVVLVSKCRLLTDSLVLGPEGCGLGLGNSGLGLEVHGLG